MDWLALLVTQVVLVMDWVVVQGEDMMDTAQCLERGFNSAKLLCSSCEDLKQFDLGQVAGDGGSAALTNTKYEKAILEVCG